MHSESFSLQFDSIQTCVDQDVPAVRVGERDGMLCFGYVGNSAVTRRIDFTICRQNPYALAEYPGSKGLIRDILHGNQLAVRRRSQQSRLSARTGPVFLILSRHSFCFCCAGFRPCDFRNGYGQFIDAPPDQFPDSNWICSEFPAYGSGDTLRMPRGSGPLNKPEHGFMTGVIVFVKTLSLPVEGQCILGQVVGTDAEEVDFLRQLVCDHGRCRGLHHDPKRRDPVRYAFG